MYSHVIRISNAIYYGNRPFCIYVIHHLTYPSKLINVEFGKAMEPRPYQVYELTFINCFHQKEDSLILKLYPPFLYLLRSTAHFL